MSKLSHVTSRKLSQPIAIDHAIEMSELAICDNDDEWAHTARELNAYKAQKKNHRKAARSKPLEIAAVQRVRSADLIFSSSELAQSHRMSATFAFMQGKPLSRRSASYPNCSEGFLFRTRRGDESPAYLHWPDRDEQSFERGADSLLELEFDATSFSQDDLMHLVLEIFVRMKLDVRLEIPRSKLRRFIMCVRHHMLKNPYHNFTHVADVVQSLYALGSKCGLLGRLSDLEVVALFTAAICHDLEHPGVSNIFVIKADPSLSRVYGESPSLEKHHSLRALSLMMHEEVELLSSLDAASYHRIRDMITKVILATDMGKHSDYMSRLENLLLPENQRDSQLEMEILIKVADTSNVLRPMHVAKKWAVHITDEFFAQGDMEAHLGLEVSHQCDRKTKTRVGLQKGFIDFVIKPFYEKLVAAYPSLETPLEQVCCNRRLWDLYDDEELLADVGR